MALSELDMMNLWAKQLTGYKSKWGRLFGFGYAVEAEVRKQDTELIRQMLDALQETLEMLDLLSPLECDTTRKARKAINAASDLLDAKP